MEINEILSIYKVAIIGLFALNIMTGLLLAHMCDCLNRDIKELRENYFDSKNA